MKMFYYCCIQQHAVTKRKVVVAVNSGESYLKESALVFVTSACKNNV